MFSARHSRRDQLLRQLHEARISSHHDEQHEINQELAAIKSERTSWLLVHFLLSHEREGPQFILKYPAHDLGLPSAGQLPLASHSGGGGPAAARARVASAQNDLEEAGTR